MAGELRDLARTVRSLPNEMVRAGTKAMQPPLDAAYRRASGDGRLSGVPGMRPFRATSRVRGTSTAKGRVGMIPAGPAEWLNSGTRPRPQGAGFHPGSPAKFTFDRTVDREIGDVLREMERVFERAVR